MLWKCSVTTIISCFACYQLGRFWKGSKLALEPSVPENTLLSNKVNFVMDEIPFVEHRRVTCGYIYSG